MLHEFRHAWPFSRSPSKSEGDAGRTRDAHYNYASSSNDLFSWMIALGRGRSWHPSSSIPDLTWDYQSIHSAPHNSRLLLNLTIRIFKTLYVTRSMFPELGNTALAEVHSEYQAQLAHQNAITSLEWKMTSLDIDYHQLGHFLSQECAPWRKFAIDVIRPLVIPLFDLDLPGRFNSAMA